jgi:virginiamycin B lyase
MRAALLILALAGMSGIAVGQDTAAEGQAARRGVKDVQVPFASLKPSATIKVGATADWVLVTDDSVWVAGTKPYSIQRIDPATNKVVARVTLPGEACSGLAFGFGSVWVPVCGEKSSLVRVDARTNTILTVLPVGPAGPEGGITTSADSVWMVTDKRGTLTRIDPVTNAVRQTISILPGSYNPLFSDGVVWITGFDSSLLVAVDASTGAVLPPIPVGPKPRFLAAGGGSMWTLNQGDGSVSRVDTTTRKLSGTIAAGIPGRGGDICYGADSAWATVFGIPLTQIDAKTNKLLRQWVGRGGDSVRFGHGSIWLTDYHHGLLWRIPYEEAQKR